MLAGANESRWLVVIVRSGVPHHGERRVRNGPCMVAEPRGGEDPKTTFTARCVAGGTAVKKHNCSCWLGTGVATDTGSKEGLTQRANRVSDNHDRRRADERTQRRSYPRAKSVHA